MTKGIKVLFLYPNTFGMNMLPPAIATFSAILKNQGHQVQVFDTTYYAIDFGIDSDGSKEDRLSVVPYSKEMEKKDLRINDVNWKEDLHKKVNEFRPDLLALSCTEDMWELGIKIIDEIKEYKQKNNIPVVAGGVFPTFAPEICIKNDLIDIVCVGEGENALIDLCKRITNKEDYTNVTNLWIKKDGKLIKKNTISDPVDVNKNPIIDTSLFEEKRLYRPMAGKVYKMYPVETIRGCPYTCKFCNSPDQMQLYKSLGHNFFRKKKMDLVYKELKHFKDEHKVEYNYFWADTFLAMNKKEFEEFCDMYQEINLPFWMQTRPETVNDYNIKKLSKVGLHRISFGVEHGNEEFRAKILDRRWKNKDIIERLKIPHKYGVQFSVNNITGFPTETKKLAFDTIELNRNIEADNQNIYGFVPFHGTPLRKMCEDLGLIKPETITKCLTDKSILNMPQYPPHEIEEIKKCFSLYVKFPKNRWKEIEKAEKNDKEGNRIYENLREEYLATYMPKPDANPHGGPESFDDVEDPYFGTKSSKDGKRGYSDEMI
ncbi:B12-binding domain-containing radical SAM protein [Pelagibacteraceae bacterium]|nr:B12-binding domain-containing radical SAM protein [Pelagibacteraceae bacterium]